MSGMNSRSRNTGTLPKSNRRQDRNTELDRSGVNQNSNYTGRMQRTLPQHSNNLFQLDWHPVSERQATTTTTSARSAKNSNARSSHAASPASSGPFDFVDFAPCYISQGRLYPNIGAREDLPSRLKMTPPVDPRTQSPPNLSTKPTNTDKMPERAQVEGRLNQVREYIKVASTMMDSLSQSSDPNGELESTESRLEQELRKKVEESQHKLAQLQEQQAQLMGLQQHVRERLNEARQAQQVLLAEDEVEQAEPAEPEEEDEEPRPTAANVEQLERETEVLRGKLQQLENKKRHMDTLVQTIQAAELAERASASSEVWPNGIRDKATELEEMKAHLAQLKALMGETTRCRDSIDVQAGSEPDDSASAGHASTAGDVFQCDGPPSGDCPHGCNDVDGGITRPKRRGESPSLKQIQTVSRELADPAQRFFAGPAEIQRMHGIVGQSNPSPSLTSCTPPPLYTEKKQSNNEARHAQKKYRQFEEFMRKEQGHGMAINQNGDLDWSSRRGSNSHSHSSMPGNLWHPPANLTNGSHELNIDGISTTGNLLDIGSQPSMENGFGGSLWGMPTLLTNQPPQGIAVGTPEYYKQLLLTSQSQQLQMMSTTIQQCCQLLWSQQRDMQIMKSAIAQLQAQLRHTQSRTSNLELHDERHSNLGRNGAEQQFSVPEVSTLPPSSSLPNLVSLPSVSPVSPAATSVSANCQQQQQQQQQHQQLNNQVPPGNRANNYWDNFRSYSRQNLLSGTPKSVADCGTSTHSTSATNTATGVAIGSHGNNKCNRQHGLENLPSHLALDTQYSLNIHSQQPQEPIAAPRNNCDPPSQHHLQQQPQQVPESPAEQSAESFRTEHREHVNESSVSIAKKISDRADLKNILKQCLEVLESRRRNGSPLLSSQASNSADSSDDESEAGTRQNAAAAITGNNNSNILNPVLDCIEGASDEFTNPISLQFIAEQSGIIPVENPSTEPICRPEVSVEPSFWLPNISLEEASEEDEPDSAERSQTHPDSSVVEVIDDDEQEGTEYVILESSQNSPIHLTNQSSQQNQQQYCKIHSSTIQK